MKGMVQIMSNLGGYQWLTTTAKKVGGPLNLVLIIATTGAGVYRGGEVLVKCGVKAIRKKCIQKKSIVESDITSYVIKAHGVSNEGLIFEIDDEFRVLESDGDAILIEKIGDKNNPYFVSADFLKEISNYKK